MGNHETKLSDEQLQKLKELLEDQHSWPTSYLFKFIVPVEKLDDVKGLFPGYDVSLRESKGGKFVALSVIVKATSADVVIAIYQQASEIEGLMSL